jgi:hypothetical protein
MKAISLLILLLASLSAQTNANPLQAVWISAGYGYDSSDSILSLFKTL